MARKHPSRVGYSYCRAVLFILVDDVEALSLVGSMDGDVDFLREALRVLVGGIMDAGVSAQIGTQHGERSPERIIYRNRTWGYPSAPWSCTFWARQMLLQLQRRLPHRPLALVGNDGYAFWMRSISTGPFPNRLPSPQNYT